jgi:hypothetical protein
MRDDCAVVVPWVSEEQLDSFRRAWNVPDRKPDWLVLQHDSQREGTGATKNKGIERATREGAEVVVVLDDDCYPEGQTGLAEFVQRHLESLEPQEVELFEAVTDPPSRGTPYAGRTVTMPVAASMGFWSEVGDYCAVRQLALGAGPMTFSRKAMHGRYFPLCGMNLAFRPKDWFPWCRFIEVLRFDDIWMGWLWQREAYRRGCCFNLAGPTVRHARQSNPWTNLRQEAEYLERNEVLWREIAMHGSGDYGSLRGLLPA